MVLQDLRVALDTNFEEFEEQTRSHFIALRANSEKLRQTNGIQRIKYLKDLKSNILFFENDIIEALKLDFKKPAYEVLLTEIYPLISEIEHCISHLSNWMKPVNVDGPSMLMFAESRIVYAPKGICLIISPWNYPFQLALSPLIPCIAAGNCAVVKPSELTPNTSIIIDKIISKTFSANHVLTIQGDVRVSEFLLKLSFDHIFFTGSTHVGKKIMSAASEHLSSLTLELGGKSPVVIDKNSDIQNAAEKIFWGKILNAGQTCVAPDYLLIQASIEVEFITHFKNIYKKYFENKDKFEMCHILNSHHAFRILRAVDESINVGNQIIVGEIPSQNSTYITPMLIKISNTDCSLMKDEIFGPILPFMTFNDADECIRLIQERPNPLALYIFSNRTPFIEKIIHSVNVGGVCVNDLIIHLANANLPFGGVKESGLGNYHGFAGFKTFSNEKSILLQKGPRIFNKFLLPPYSMWKVSLIKLLIKLGI